MPAVVTSSPFSQQLSRPWVAIPDDEAHDAGTTATREAKDEARAPIDPAAPTAFFAHYADP